MRWWSIGNAAGDLDGVPEALATSSQAGAMSTKRL
jgi:hypothetical protein